MKSYNLKISNFQSIKEQSLDLKGFVAITGRSNLGKSAVRRSLQAVLFNSWDKSFRRTGTNLPTKVTLSREEDYSIEMSKSDDLNRYKVTSNGSAETYDKVGKTVPDIIPSLGFKTMSMGDFDLNLNISKQTDPMFVISFKDSTNTKLLNNIFNISKLEKASSLTQKDIRQFKIDSNKLTEEYNVKKNLLTTLEDKHKSLNDMYNKASKLISDSDLIEEYINSSASYDKSSSTLKDTIDSHNLLLEELKQLTKLQKLIVYLDMNEGIAKQTYAIVDLKESLSSLKLKLDKMKSYEIKLSSLSKLETYLKSDSDLRTINSRLEHLSRNEEFISNFTNNRKIVNLIYQTEREESFNLKSIKKSKELNRLESYISKYKNFSLLLKYLALAVDIEDLERLYSNLSTESLEQELYTLNETKIKMSKICECCGQPIPDCKE